MDAIKLQKELKRLEDVCDAASDLYHRGLVSIDCLNDSYRELEMHRDNVKKSSAVKEKANG